MSYEKLQRFRDRYKVIKILPPDVKIESGKSFLVFKYEIGTECVFQTSYELPFEISVEDQVIRILLNYLSVVESFSYWKLMCPETIELSSFSLDLEEKKFFSNLLWQGMSEFLYRNELPLDISIDFASELQNGLICKNKDFKKLSKGYLILVGGGKDSVVSLELMKSYSGSKNIPCVPFSLNPINASYDTISVSKLSDFVIASRKIDPSIHDLNQQGYFNGHIPFSAVLSFVSSIVAYSKGLDSVLVSNESSANQGNVIVDGIIVNHQYSKSFDFESSLRNLFVHKKIPISYFSLLRPLSELQIVKIFSELKQYHLVFQSCNVRQTIKEKERLSSSNSQNANDRWCGSCPKCVFVFIMLSAFLEKEELVNIFGIDISQKQEFLLLIKELLGESGVKPFECVGTFEEIRLAYDAYFGLEKAKSRILSHMQTFDDNHFLDNDLFTFLKERVLK